MLVNGAISSVTGNVTLQGGGRIEVEGAITVTGTGNVLADSRGGILKVLGTISTATGNVSLYATDDVLLGDATHNASLITNEGTIDVRGKNFRMHPQSQARAPKGDIEIRVREVAELSRLIGQDVLLESRGGVGGLVSANPSLVENVTADTFVMDGFGPRYPDPGYVLKVRAGYSEIRVDSGLVFQHIEDNRVQFTALKPGILMHQFISNVPDFATASATARWASDRWSNGGTRPVPAAGAAYDTMLAARELPDGGFGVRQGNTFGRQVSAELEYDVRFAADFDVATADLVWQAKDDANLTRIYTAQFGGTAALQKAALLGEPGRHASVIGEDFDDFIYDYWTDNLEL